VASQQSAYGGYDFPPPKNTDSQSSADSSKNKRKEPEKDQESEKKNTVVYVSGLPLDITLDEVKETFEKCGIIKLDFETGELVQLMPFILMFCFFLFFKGF